MEAFYKVINVVSSTSPTLGQHSVAIKTAKGINNYKINPSLKQKNILSNNKNECKPFSFNEHPYYMKRYA